MKIKVFNWIFAAALLSLAAGFGAFAAQEIYVNDADSVLSQPFGRSYAIGEDGTALLPGNDVYVLSSSGVSMLGTTDPEGGGGLLYDDGEVMIRSDVIKVGLRFNFNRDRSDTTVETAELENLSGAGFAFGYYDAQRCFVELEATEETRVLLRALEDEELKIGVYSAVSGELLYSTNYANTKENYLAVHPRNAEDGDALTAFDGLRYFGDFEFAFTAGEGITVVNTLDIEKYLIGVCAVEMPASSPKEAYKAQAVAARSYAQYCIGVTDLYDYYGFDVTNNTYYQAYYGYYIPNQANISAVISAVEETENQYLTYQGQVIEALFFAADGGETKSAQEVFGSEKPYLIGYSDPYEAAAYERGAYGHQVGLSQWGAYAMAKYYNKTYKDILGFYYTGVGLSYGFTA